MSWEVVCIKETQKDMKKLEEENPCLKISDLKINGNDLISLGYTGKEIGNILEKTLNKILKNELTNSKEDIINFLKKENNNEV